MYLKIDQNTWTNFPKVIDIMLDVYKVRWNWREVRDRFCKSSTNLPPLPHTFFYFFIFFSKYIQNSKTSYGRWTAEISVLVL